MCVCVLSGEAYTCLEAATGRVLLRQHMDNTGEDHPLNKLRVRIEPGGPIPDPGLAANGLHTGAGRLASLQNVGGTSLLFRLSGLMPRRPLRRSVF